VFCGGSSLRVYLAQAERKPKSVGKSLITITSQVQE
jgi:hypothetical protein